MSDNKVGVKHDQQKIRLELLSPIALEELSKVLTFGANKYAAWNWSNGLSYTRVLGALLRHTFAYMRGESHDPETGLSHMAHAMCNCMFLLHFEKMRPEFDDRETSAYRPVDNTPKVNDNNDKEKK